MIGAAADRPPALHAEAADGALIAYRVHRGAAERGAARVDTSGTGSAERGARAAERGARAAERGTGAAESGTGSAERGASASARAGAGVHADPPPVLLVHGFASNSRITWEGTGWVKTLTDAGRTVVTVDLRGHGESDQPVEADDYRPRVLGADLVAVLDSVGVGRVDAVGYSMGCRVVSALAELEPDRVRRVVLGGAGPRELFAAWRIDEVRALLADDVPAANPVIEQVLRPALDAGADREVLLAVVEGFAGAPLAVPGGSPTLFVAGERDTVPEGVQDLALEWGAEFVSIPGRDHVSTLTSRVFKDAAIGFLAD